MSDENFINRWSRRKREAADESVQPKKTDPTQTMSAGRGARSQLATTGKSSADAFDVSSLPSIESIGAGTDITAFLQAGLAKRASACGPSAAPGRPIRRSAILLRAERKLLERCCRRGGSPRFWRFGTQVSM